MSAARFKPPSYRHHKASGQAVVTLSGRDIYLGPHGTRISRDQYDRVVGEWMAAGRTLPKTQNDTPITVVEVCNAFRKAGVAPATHVDEYLTLMEMMVRLYGRTSAAEFGPVALKVVRGEMEAAGWKRRTINQRVHYVRRIFRWAVEHQMVDADRIVALRALEPLKKGQTVAGESYDTEAVAVEHVEQCVRFMPPTVAAMVKLQLYAGMRAGELCDMTSGDIETKDDTVWVYRPGQHKTKHRGKVREIALGPKAIEVLRPLLLPDLGAYIFSPARAAAERQAERTADRKTPPGQGNTVGSNRVRRPVKTPGARYDTDSYRRAIEYATRRAFPPPAALARKRGERSKEWRERLGPKKWAALVAFRKSVHWHPHQLRHTFGVLVGNMFTMEHAQRSLGHANMKATQIYAKLSLDKAKEVARAIG